MLRKLILKWHLILRSITFYAGNFRDISGKEYNREIQDTYHQLDKDLKQLLDLIDKKVGLSQILVVLSGTGYFKNEETLPDEMELAGEEFHQIGRAHV